MEASGIIKKLCNLLEQTGKQFHQILPQNRTARWVVHVLDTLDHLAAQGSLGSSKLKVNNVNLFSFQNTARKIIYKKCAKKKMYLIDFINR